MRIIMMTAIAALAFGTVATAKPTRMKAPTGSAATKELNRKSLEQATAMNGAAPMAEASTSAAPMADPAMAAPPADATTMNPGNSSTTAPAPAGDATQPGQAPTGMTPSATTPQ